MTEGLLLNQAQHVRQGRDELLVGLVLSVCGNLMKMPTEKQLIRRIQSRQAGGDVFHRSDGSIRVDFI